MKRKHSVRVRRKYKNDGRIEKRKYVFDHSVIIRNIVDHTESKHNTMKDDMPEDTTECATNYTIDATKAAIMMGGREKTFRAKWILNAKTNKETKPPLLKSKLGRCKTLPSWKVLSGIVAVVASACILVIGIPGIIMTSPFSIVIYGENDAKGECSLSKAKEMIEREFAENIQRELSAWEADSIVFVLDSEEIRIQNWNEIIALYAMCVDVVSPVIDENQMKLLRKIVNDTNIMEIQVQYGNDSDSVVEESTNEDEMVSKIIVSFVTKKLEDVAIEYGMSEQERILLTHVLQEIEKTTEQ